jgi:hypothetical protein
MKLKKTEDGKGRKARKAGRHGCLPFPETESNFFAHCCVPPRVLQMKCLDVANSRTDQCVSTEN